MNYRMKTHKKNRTQKKIINSMAFFIFSLYSKRKHKKELDVIYYCHIREDGLIFETISFCFLELGIRNILEVFVCHLFPLNVIVIVKRFCFCGA